MKTQYRKRKSKKGRKKAYEKEKSLQLAYNVCAVYCFDKAK